MANNHINPDHPRHQARGMFLSLVSLRRLQIGLTSLAIFMSLSCYSVGEPDVWAEYLIAKLMSDRDTILVGETMRMTAVDDNGAAISGPELDWSSSDTSVIRVTYDGVVIGYGEGSATIVAFSGYSSALVQIHVRDVPLVFTSIEAGCEHTCALALTGDAFCWGRNDYGQLGHESTRFCSSDYEPRNVRCSPNPTVAAAGIAFRSLTAGCYHTCGVSVTGEAYCWGRNDHGQLGDGTILSRRTPAPVHGNRTYSVLNADHIHTCGIAESGELFCWGVARTGELGAAGSFATTPAGAVRELRFEHVETEYGHTCALTESGETYCWGNNYSGVLGVADPDSTCASAVGPIACTSTPQLVEDAPKFVQLDAGGGTNCGRTEAGHVYCWGMNDRGQLGDGTSNGGWQPRQVLGERSYARVSVGHRHTCAVTAEYAAYCWGRNAGTFGNGNDVEFSYEPIPGADGLRVATLSAGFEHTCGLSTTGEAYCWGRNWQGQVGNGEHGLNERVLLPERVRRRR